jgi:hypothetical protein
MYRPVIILWAFLIVATHSTILDGRIDPFMHYPKFCYPSYSKYLTEYIIFPYKLLISVLPPMEVILHILCFVSWKEQRMAIMWNF